MEDLTKYFDKSQHEELVFEEDADKSTVVAEEEFDTPEERLNAMFEPKKKEIKNFQIVPKTISLSVEQFNTFMSVIKGLHYSCSDIIINKGIISQFNERKTFIFNIDLRSILGDACLIMNNLDLKHKLFSSLFQKQNVDVVLDITENDYTIRDSSCKITFKCVDTELIDSKFLTDKELKSTILKDVDREIFTYKFKKMMISRIISSASLLASPSMRILFEGDKASLIIQPLDATNNTVATIGIIEDELEDTSLQNVLITTKVMTFLNFLNAGCEEIDSSLHFRKTTEPTCCLQLKSVLEVAGSDLKVPFSIYSMMNFINPEDYLS